MSALLPIHVPSRTTGVDSLLPNDAMPRRAVHPIKFLLDEHGHVLLDIVPLQRGSSRIHRGLLHLFVHWGHVSASKPQPRSERLLVERSVAGLTVYVLDDCFPGRRLLLLAWAAHLER